ncbi:serine-rich adhesin for platelets-like isoform X2 [Periplaneta americana]|uniref:serine-rich adhesin for platelets-like isoform X2 n=1 Tax=Periplaneta americana TaxID=6978 RepID=UPI0037E917D5
MDTEEDDKSCIIERLDSCEASNPQSSDSGEEPDCTVNEYSTRNYFTSSGIFNCFRSGDKSLSKSVDKIDNSGEDDELTTLGDIDASVAHTELAVASANNTQCEDAFGINYNTHIGEPNRKNDSKKDAEDCSVVSKLETSDKITECDLPNNEHSEISHMACGKDSFAETVKEEIKECEMNEDMKSDIACSAVSRSMDEQTADSYNQCQPNKVGGEHGHIVNSKTFNSTAIGDTNKSTQTVEISDTSQCSLTFDQCLKIKKTRSFNDKTECDENITATGDSVMNQSIEKGMDFHSETTTSENRYQKPKTEDLNSSSLKMMPKTYFTTATDATNTHESHTGVTFTSECAAKKETKDTSTLIGLGFSNGILTSDVGQKQLHCGLATSTPESVTPSTSFTNNTNSIMYEGATGLFGTVSDQDLTKLRQLSLQPMKPPELSSYKPVPLFSESFTSSSTVPSLPLLLPPVSSFQLEPNYSSNSSVGDSQNLHLSPKFANANNSLQNSAEKTKVSFSFPLKSTQNTGFGESSVFSNMPASKNTPAVNVPLKYATGDSEINNISDSSTDKPSFNFCPGNPSFPPPIFGKHLDTGNAGPVTATPGFAFRFATPFKVVNSSVDINTNTATGNIPKLDVKCPKSDNIVGTFGQNIFFSGVTKQPESSSFNFGKIGLNITTAETNNFSSSPTFSFGSIARASEENSESSKSGDLFGSKPLPQSDCKSKETNRMLFNSFGMKDKDVPQFTWNSPKEKTTLPVPVTASLSTLFSFGSVQGQNTSNSFSALNSSPSSKPFPSTPSNSFSSGSVFNRFSIGVSSPATSSTVMFNFKASDKKLKQKSSRVVTPAQLKLRIQKPTPNKSEIPFRVVTEADTYVKNGITYSITSHHQHITAMPEYSSLSFEELRLQYAKYNVNQPTETKTTTANKILCTAPGYLIGALQASVSVNYTVSQCSQLSVKCRLYNSKCHKNYHAMMPPCGAAHLSLGGLVQLSLRT